MPELPEVETIAKQLKDVLTGRKIVNISVLRAKSFEGDKENLVGKIVSDVKRKAKMLWLEFKDDSRVVMIHLKMTGQLIFVSKHMRIAGGHPTADWVNKLPGKHTRVIIEFEDKSTLFFNDLRVFGWVKLVERRKLEEIISKLPPDVTELEFTHKFFADKLKRIGRPIKVVLLDSSVLGGVGNIYANDALYLAGIDPRRKAKDLKNDETKKLYESVKQAINLGIKYGGASASNYVDVSGMGGSYQKHFLTYKRDGLPCLSCGSPIKKIKLGGRGTFFCSNCQS